MIYRLDLGAWSSIFAVPSELVDKHLKLCGENELKFILWTLRHCGKGFDFEAVTKGTGIPAAAVGDCVDYWVQAGLICADDGALLPASSAIHAAPTSAAVPPEPEAPALQAVVERKMLRPDGIYMAKRMAECPDLAMVLREAEMVLGKTLSPSLSAVLINAHDDYNLPTEVILMLISYVGSIGKTSTPYIEALTKNWAESGVHSMEAAEKKIMELNEKALAWKTVLSATGISYRMPSKKEADEAYHWIYELHLSRELIAEGYERCVDNIGKFSMRYMNKIFEGWSKLQLTTPESVRDYEMKFK
ncbi:MAG: DnaD domain protein, partial [Oscillospiraceae bacterium]